MLNTILDTGDIAGAGGGGTRQNPYHYGTYIQVIDGKKSNNKQSKENCVVLYGEK